MLWSVGRGGWDSGGFWLRWRVAGCREWRIRDIPADYGRFSGDGVVVVPDASDFLFDGAKGMFGRYADCAP